MVVSSSSSSGTSAAARAEYSKIGADVKPPPPTRRGYGSHLLFCIASLAASIALALLLLFLLRPSHHPRPSAAHSSPSPSPPPLPSPSPPLPRSPSPSPFPTPSTSLSSTLVALCNSTPYSLLCTQTLISLPSAPSSSLHQLLALFSSVALDHVNQTYSFALNFTRTHDSDPAVPLLHDCLELMDSGRDELVNSIARLSQLDPKSSTFHNQLKDVQVWLSAAFTDQDTCSDDFQDVTGEVKDQMVQKGELICKYISIALSLAERLQASSLNVATPAFAPTRS